MRTRKIRGSVTPALLTVDQTAEYLGLGPARVWAMVAAGDLPSIKIGRSRRVVKSDLDDFIAQIRNGSIDGRSLAGPPPKEAL